MLKHRAGEKKAKEGKKQDEVGIIETDEDEGTNSWHMWSFW